MDCRTNESFKEELKGVIINRWNDPAGIQNLYMGSSVFLLLSGPSLSKNDLTKLDKRGIITFGVNNSPAVFKPNIWTFVDPSSKFHHGIWYDPSILKIVPLKRFKDYIREKKSDGFFYYVRNRVRQLPGVLGYRRNAEFNPSAWLYESTINWGNDKKSAEKNGLPHILNVMFASLKLCFYLGFRTVYLLGCDFKMSLDSQNYAFPQDRTEDSVRGNNSSYEKLNYMLGLLYPFFQKERFNVYNCNKDSGLNVFPYLSFDAAVKESTKLIPQTLDTLGWYD